MPLVRMPAGVQRHGRLLLCLWLIALGGFLPAGGQAQTPGIPAARELANTFTAVSRQALPAVVFITVTNTVDTQNPSSFNSPFDLFGEEFFELGVRMQELTKALAASRNIQTTEGVLMADVSSGSPAAKAGLKRGDVIISVNSTPVHEPGQLRNLVAMTAPGTKTTLGILRENGKQEISVILGELPGEATAQTGEETPPAAGLGRRYNKGSF